MRSDTPLHDLQAAYRAAKGAQRTPDVAQAIGISTLTLLRFEREGLVSMLTKQQIATWVRHERTRDQEMDW